MSQDKSIIYDATCDPFVSDLKKLLADGPVVMEISLSRCGGSQVYFVTKDYEQAQACLRHRSQARIKVWKMPRPLYVGAPDATILPLFWFSDELLVGFNSRWCHAAWYLTWYNCADYVA